MATVEVRDYNLQFLEAARTASLDYPSVQDGDRLIFVIASEAPSLSSRGDHFAPLDPGWRILEHYVSSNTALVAFTKVYSSTDGDTTGTIQYPRTDQLDSFSAILSIKNGVFLDNYSRVSNETGTANITLPEITTPSSSTFNLYFCSFTGATSGTIPSNTDSLFFTSSGGTADDDRGLLAFYDYTQNAETTGEKIVTLNDSIQKRGMTMAFASNPPEEVSSATVSLPIRSKVIYPFHRKQSQSAAPANQINIPASGIFGVGNTSLTGSNTSPSQEIIDVPEDLSSGDVLIFHSVTSMQDRGQDTWMKDIRFENIWLHDTQPNAFVGNQIAMRYLPRNYPNVYVLSEDTYNGTRAHALIQIKNMGQLVTQSSKLIDPFAIWTNQDHEIENNSIIFTFAQYEAENFTISTPTGSTLLYNNEPFTGAAQAATACWYEYVDENTSYLSKSFGENGFANRCTLVDVIFKTDPLFVSNIESGSMEQITTFPRLRTTYPFIRKNN